MTALFRLSDVTKVYGQREVLNVNELAIEPGFIHTVMGPNGAGKTTLIRVMSLISVNSSGALEVFGEKVDWSRRQVIKLRRQMAMVTQSSFMFEGSVYYNVAYGLRVRKKPEREIKKTVQECLELLGMHKFIDYQARRLSGGERQKVAIARALAVSPRVLFLDEPTSNIDPSSARDIEKHIKDINAGGTTIVLVTHNIFQAHRLAQVVYVMWDGRVIEKGPVAKMFENATDTRVSAFLSGQYYN